MQRLVLWNFWKIKCTECNAFNAPEILRLECDLVKSNLFSSLFNDEESFSVTHLFIVSLKDGACFIFGACDILFTP